MINQSLFDANLRYFERNHPAIYERIKGLTQLVAKPVIEDGKIIDIDLGEARLYKQDGCRMGKEQAEIYAAAPTRSGYDAVEGITSDSLVSRRFYEGMIKNMGDQGVKSLSVMPLGRSSYLVVFGIGLGYHLDHLAELIDVDHLVVLEAMDEFFVLSMRCVDYTALAAKLAERDCKLHIALAPDSGALVAAISAVVHQVGEIFLDGVYLYRHYPFWPLDEAYKRFLDEIPVKMIGRGYYEDERKMVRNAAANLHKFDHYLLSGNFRRRYDVPAFIVAAGPSLDADLEFIRQWQDHAMIFSSGTTIQPLLAAGIIPDYHVELENTPHTYTMCEHILKTQADMFPEGRFSGIKMLASVTVNPRVPELFDENYFFYRDAVSSTSCFSAGVTMMNGVGPCIANTSIAVAARLGFETMYLFGVDCGWRDAKNHHSKNTIYYTVDEYLVDQYDSKFSSPGNFGGTIHSNLVYTWTREMIEQKVDRFSLKLINCSDGAFIKGTTPKLAETLVFDGAPLNKQEVFNRIRDESKLYRAGEYLAKQSISGLVEEIGHLRVAFNEMIDSIATDGGDFRDFIARITDFDREGYRGAYKSVYPMLQGPVVGFTKAASYYLNRIENEAARAPAFKTFLGLYRDLHNEMFDEAEQIFTEIKAMVETGIEPEWADGIPKIAGTTY